MQDHIQRVVARSKAFYKTAEPGHFLINVQFPVECDVAVPALTDIDLETQLEERLAAQLEASRYFHEAKQGLDDDSAPGVAPHFGIAEHSAWLGLNVHMQETTCLPEPIINQPDDIDKLQVNTQTPWYRIMQQSYEFFRERQDGTFLLLVRGSMMPMDLANAVRGNEIFTDFLLDPEFSHRLMQKLTDAVQWYYQQLLSWTDAIDGGHFFSYGGGWMEPDTFGHVSNDAAMLCSADVYKEFGFPYEKQLAENFSGILYHVHNEKMHYVPQLAKLPNLKMLEIAPDPKTAPPIEDLPRILAHTGNSNLMLHASADQIRKYINDLMERNVFLQVHCKDRTDAEDVITFVREHSKPLE